MFLTGVKTLYKKSLLPIGRSFTVTIAYMLWGSMFLGFFSDHIHFLGGTFGFFINDWLIQTLGKMGTMTLTLVLLYVITTLIFNPNYSALFNYLFPKKVAEPEEDAAIEDNMTVINPMSEEDITEDVISESVDFSENKDEESPKESEEEKQTKQLCQANLTVVYYVVSIVYYNYYVCYSTIPRSVSPHCVTRPVFCF